MVEEKEDTSNKISSKEEGSETTILIQSVEITVPPGIYSIRK